MMIDKKMSNLYDLNNCNTFAYASININKGKYCRRASLTLSDIPNSGIELEQLIGNTADELCMSVSITVLKDSVEYVTSSWWQHFKKDFFPDWALKRWPVKYDSLELVVKHKPDISMLRQP